MAAKILNIELGDQIIKVCRTSRRGKGVHIFDSFMFPTPENCVSDGAVLNPQLLSHELKKQLTSHGLQNIKNVIFVLSSSKIAAREVKLPRMNKKLLSTAIRTNAEDYFPIDLKDFHVTYSVLEAASVTVPSYRVLVMAVPESTLDGYFQLAEKTGLSIKAIDSCGNSQYQAISRIANKGITLYVDVNISSSIVSFVRDGNLLLQRSFTIGVEDLISRYMALSGKSKEQYLDILHEIDTTNSEFAANELLSLSDVQNDLSHLANGITRSIDYFNSSQWDAPVSRIVLMGLNCHVLGLHEIVSEVTGLETLYLDSIADFSTLTGNVPDASTYINCIGSSFAPLDLIPQKFVSSRRKVVDDKDATIIPGIIACSAIILLAIAVSLFSWLNYKSSIRELQRAQAEISSLEYTRQTYDYFVSYQKSEGAVDAFTGDANAPNSMLVSFFDELEKKMPSSILLLSADCTNDGVSLNITVANYVDAAAVISNLRTFQSLSKIDVGDMSTTENEAGVMRISFSALCTYGTNPYLTNTNPYSEIVNTSPSAPQSGVDTAITTNTDTGTAPEAPSESPEQ